MNEYLPVLLYVYVIIHDAFWWKMTNTDRLWESGVRCGLFCYDAFTRWEKMHQAKYIKL